MTAGLTTAEELKFRLLAEGLVITDAALEYIALRNSDRSLTPADYASTSGIILELEDGVWVNAPIAEHNANFVALPAFRLVVDDDRLVIEGDGLASSAAFWIQPAWHGQSNEVGEAYNSYAYMHCDRVRISPVEGCAIVCTFCDLPYEFRYRTKRIAGLVEVIRTAVDDPVQPAGHILISGGTPRPEDYDYLQESYATVITTFPELAVDIMMVPMAGLLDVAELRRLGLAELSINIEIFSRPLARRVMRRKHDLGPAYYLDFLEQAANELGGSKVRSMLLVGIEPPEETLAGVEEIARRGCVPVLSPFRPDPSTPMRNAPPPSGAVLRETYLRAFEIAERHGVPLGPPCIPCAHNTLTLTAATGNGSANLSHRRPNLV